MGEVGHVYVTTDEAERMLQRRVLTEILTACAASADKIVTARSRRT